jgi:hypothetical protein
LCGNIQIRFAHSIERLKLLRVFRNPSSLQVHIIIDNLQLLIMRKVCLKWSLLSFRKVLVPYKEYDVTFPPSDLRSLIHQLTLLTSCCSYISSTVCSFTYTEHRIIHIPTKYVIAYYEKSLFEVVVTVLSQGTFIRS